MKRNIIILLLTMLCGAGLTYWLDYTQNRPSAALISSEAPTMQGEIVPDFTFQTLNGTRAAVKDLRGKSVVLNFWASWCAPCVKEFPLFMDMALAHKDDVVFLALSSDHDMAAMNRFLDKMRGAHPEAMASENVMIALDEDGAITRGLFQTFRLPETIIIDGEGVMREKLIGANWSAADLERLIDKI